MSEHLCLTCSADCKAKHRSDGTVVRCGAYRPPATNGDRIRSMSDEELTKMLQNRQLVCEFDHEWCERRESCENCTAEWLRSPARKENNGTTDL